MRKSKIQIYTEEMAKMDKNTSLCINKLAYLAGGRVAGIVYDGDFFGLRINKLGTGEKCVWFMKDAHTDIPGSMIITETQKEK